MIREIKDKISHLRKEYKITQNELAQDTLSQSYIAAIENGTRNLSDDTAVFFVDNFNKIFSQRGYEIQITKDWLMEEVEVQIRNRYDFYYDYFLNWNNYDSLEEIVNEFSLEEGFFSISEKTILYHYLAVIYMELDNYNLAHEAYRKIYFFLNEIENKELLSKIIYNVLSIFKVIGEYERVIEFQDLYLSEKENITDYYKKYIYDAFIDLFNEIGDYGAVLSYLEELALISDDNEKRKIEYNKLQIYINLKMFDLAKKSYGKLEKDIAKYQYSYQFYFKLQGLELFRALEKKSKVRKIYKELVELEEKVTIILDTRSFFVRGEAASFLNKRKEMIKYLTFACSMFDFSDYSSVELKYFRNILTRTLPECNRRDFIIVKTLWEKAKELIEINGDNRYIFYFIDYFLKNRYYDELKDINKEIIEFYSENGGINYDKLGPF